MLRGVPSCGDSSQAVHALCPLGRQDTLNLVAANVPAATGWVAPIGGWVGGPISAVQPLPRFFQLSHLQTRCLDVVCSKPPPSQDLTHGKVTAVSVIVQSRYAEVAAGSCCGHHRWQGSCCRQHHLLDRPSQGGCWPATHSCRRERCSAHAGGKVPSSWLCARFSTDRYASCAQAADRVLESWLCERSSTCGRQAPAHRRAFGA